MGTIPSVKQASGEIVVFIRQKECIMATGKDVILEQLGMGDYLFNQFTADLSDEEYFKAPVPRANHAGWIIGHIAVSEDSLVAAATGKPKRIPEATQDLFKGGSTCKAEASVYPSRKQIDELYKNTRAHTLEALKASDESKWSAPSPEGFTKEVFPTMGSIWGLLSTHQYWHIGQLTVCRAAMNKKHVLM